MLHTESASGIAVLVAAIIALIWANSPWADAYHAFWETPLALRVGGFVLPVASAVGGMLLPALLYVAVTRRVPTPVDGEFPRVGLRSSM